MLRLDRDALICDLAETYHIYDYKRLPARLLAVLASGLRDDSRIKMKITGAKLPMNTILLAGIHDRLSILLWGMSEDGKKGRNKPKLIMDELNAKPSKFKAVSKDEYWRIRNSIVGKEETDGG